MVTGTLLTSDFDYQLPSELIAQFPAPDRDASRLMVVDRQKGTIQHSSFDRLADFVHAGDALVLNRSRVIRARLRLTRPTGGSAELLLLRPLSEGRWLALGRPSRKLTSGMDLRTPDAKFSVHLDAALDEGQWMVRFDPGTSIHEFLERYGEIPIPPYIRQLAAGDNRYQTVYGDRDGSVAAPTAGLHFTPRLMERISSLGVGLHYVTLHVGMGTFRPVAVDRVNHHTMHAEWGEVPESVAQSLNQARQTGNRVIAVGTTTTRLLETAMQPDGIHPWVGDTNMFIYPGYCFQAIDALVTNFHLPRSTLLMLVSAFAGREFVLQAYEEAIRERYRFFSFGDAMLIL